MFRASLFAGLLSLALPAALRAAGPAVLRAAVPPEVDGPVIEGLHAIFAMDFDGAEADFKKAQAAMPEHPYGYYGQAIVSWARFVYGSQLLDKAAEKKFEQDTDVSIAKSLAWLRNHPEDAPVHLSLGGSYGLRSRLGVIQKKWFRTLWDGRAGIKVTRRAYALDPELKDALLGIGMYDYFADALPRGVAFFSHMLLGGDRKKGIEELKVAAENGRYVDVGAKLVLVEIYTEDAWGAKDPAAALAIIQGLRKDYPNSPMIHQIEQVCLYETGRYEELLASVDLYIKRIQEKMPYYPEFDLARQYLTMGTAKFAMKRHEEAERDLEASAKLAGTPKAPSRWGVWGLVRLGHVRDVQGRRADAVAAYKAALAFPDNWGFNPLVKKWVSTPFTLKGGLGQLPPP